MSTHPVDNTIKTYTVSPIIGYVGKCSETFVRCGLERFNTLRLLMVFNVKDCAITPDV